MILEHDVSHGQMPKPGEKPSGIIAFGDEVGLPVVLQVIHEALVKKPDACVIDPRRKEVQRWYASQAGSLRILLHPEKHQRSSFVRELARLNPSLGIIFSYSRILWPELIETFPLGVVNLHGGKLPEYRGANVLQWLIINGETQTTMTLHYIDAGTDSGPVIAELPIAIENKDTALTLRDKMCQGAGTILAEWLPRLISGRVKAHPQDESRAKAWPRRKPEDGRIDFSFSDEKIRNMTRALVKPWPGAYYIDPSGKKITIDRALSLEEVAELRRKMQSENA